MPLYEYRCESCGELFEVRQKFADEPVSTHEKCGGHVERLVSAPTFNFKGSGWYVTDYAKGNKASSNGESGKPGSDGKEPASTKESDSGKKDSSPAPSTPSDKGGSSSSQTKSNSDSKPSS